MSVQNLLLRQYLALRIKRRVGNGMSFAAMRRELDDAIATYMPPPPNGIEVKPAQGKIAAEWVRPKAGAKEFTVLYFHGGGFVMGSPLSHRGVSCGIARELGCAVLVPSYRLAPEHPYPAALEDAERAYDWLARIAPASEVVVAGDQAGAWLAFALLLRLRDRGAAMPAACVALSPLVDLTLSAASIADNEHCDPAGTHEALRRCVDAFAPPGGRETPELSPLFADLSGLPSTLIQVSTIELLRDDSTRMAAALKRSRVPVTLSEWNKVPPMWHIFAAGLPEARDSIREIAKFVREQQASADASLGSSRN